MIYTFIQSKFNILIKTPSEYFFLIKNYTFFENLFTVLNKPLGDCRFVVGVYLNVVQFTRTYHIQNCTFTYMTNFHYIVYQGESSQMKKSTSVHVKARWRKAHLHGGKYFEAVKRIANEITACQTIYFSEFNLCVLVGLPFSNVGICISTGVFTDFYNRLKKKLKLNQVFVPY